MRINIFPEVIEVLENRPKFPLKEASHKAGEEETLLNLWVQEKLSQTEHEQKAEQKAGAYPILTYFHIT